MAKTGPFSRELLVVIVVIAVLAVSVVAYFGYSYYQEQQRQAELHRSAVQAAYQGNLTKADSAYATIQGLQAVQNKNRTVDYRKWIDNYRALLGNYYSAVNETVTAGDAYRQAFGNGSEEEAWIIQNNTRLNESMENLSGRYAGYEADYNTVVAARDRARQAYEAAYANATASYDRANGCLNLENYSAAYPGLKAYMKACSLNITLYKESINATDKAAAQYYVYLRTDSREFDDVQTQIDYLNRQTPSLERRYTGLQSKIPAVDVTIGSTDKNYSGDLGWYLYATFLVTNHAYPTPVWNVTAHFTSYDKATGALKDKTDVPVVINAQMSKYHGAILKMDRDHTYDIKWTLSYDY